VRTIAAALAAALLLVACGASTEPSDVVRVAVLDAGVSSELPEFDNARSELAALARAIEARAREADAPWTWPTPVII
jgi:hypothetical protein